MPLRMDTCVPTLATIPKFVLIKKYSSGGNSWAVYCDGVGAGPNKQILLNYQ